MNEHHRKYDIGERVGVYHPDSLTERHGKVVGLTQNTVKVRIEDPDALRPSKTGDVSVNRIESFSDTFPGLRSVRSNNVDSDFGLQGILRFQS